jgi:hypothetical protein
MLFRASEIRTADRQKAGSTTWTSSAKLDGGAQRATPVRSEAEDERRSREQSVRAHHFQKSAKPRELDVAIDTQQLQQLVEAPSERLDVELKGWWRASLRRTEDATCRRIEC